MTQNKKGLILIDHGSKIPEANKLLEDIAIELRNDPRCQFEVVEHCHMELSPPTLEDAYLKCVKEGVNEVIVHPYFLVPGRHSMSDIPNMVKVTGKNYPNVKYKITDPLGLHKNILDVILERVNSC